MIDVILIDSQSHQQLHKLFTFFEFVDFQQLPVVVDELRPVDGSLDAVKRNGG